MRRSTTRCASPRCSDSTTCDRRPSSDATDADVGNVIGFAKRFGLRTAVRSGGHCFAGRSSTDGVVIDVSPMRSVTVTDGAVTVGAGTRLGELYDALDRHGLTIAAGCGPTVGIAGLTLGGGLGILGRRYGLTCDQLRGARVVLADGRVVECDERRDEDLFWALRGAGGGTLGVVTSLDFATVPAPPGTGFHLVWPHSAAAAVIEAWQEWAPDAPDELAASLLVKAGSDADRPPVVNVFGAMLGAESTVDLLDELVARAGQDPDVGRSCVRVLPRYQAIPGRPRRSDGWRRASRLATSQPGPVYSKSEFFRRPLPTGTIAALVDNLLGAGCQASRERWTSPRWPAPTTGCHHTRRPSPIVTSGSCSSTSSSSTPGRRPPRLVLGAAG